MARTKNSKLNGEKRPKVDHVDDLLVPLMTFLSRSGLTEAQILSQCSAAIRRGKRTRLGPKVARIGSGHDSSILVARWLRDPTYLNRAGRPGDIPLQGRGSLSSLLADCGVNTTLNSALSLLLRYGTVRKTPNGKYRLVKRYMNYAIPGLLPFEPNMQFMIDAVRATTRGLGLSRPQPRVFCKWVDNVRIPRRYEGEFSSFAERRGLAFLHEINDWLDEHCHLPLQEYPRSAKISRLGMGLFGIRSGKV